MTLRPLWILAIVSALPACSAFTEPQRAVSSPLATPATARNETALYLNVVDGLLAQKRFGAALAFLDDYSRKESNLPPRYWLMRGNALIGLERHSDAAGSYGRLESTSLAAEGWNGLGRAAASRKEWRVAADQFRKAVEARPASVEFINNLAYSSMKSGDIATSLSCLRQARDLDPSSDLVRNNLIIALTLSGDTTSANALAQTIADPRLRQNVEAMAQAMKHSKRENG